MKLQLSTIVQRLGKQISGGANSVLRLGVQFDDFSRQFDKKGAGGVEEAFESVLLLC
jgi:hypothetical protein